MLWRCRAGDDCGHKAARIWSELVGQDYPKAKNGRPPFGIETMLRVHCLQQRFALPDPAMEEALHDMQVSGRSPSSQTAYNGYLTTPRSCGSAPRWRSTT